MLPLCFADLFSIILPCLGFTELKDVKHQCFDIFQAYVYSPTTAQTRETHLMRDNPAFSMVNESDDESEAMLLPRDDDAEPGSSGAPLRGLSLGHDDDSD